MADAGVRIRPGTEQDVPAILELMRASLGEGEIPRTPRFWSWKHVESPFGRSPFWVAESGTTLVGVRVFMRWTFRSGDAEIRAVRAVDTATHPDFQGRGIFKRLTLELAEEMGREGVPFVYNTPNDKSRPGYLKMGWQVVGRLPLWARPCARGLVARALGRSLGTPGPASVALARGSVPEAPRGRDASGRLHTEPTQEYLRWRYAACPAVRYGFASTDPARALVVYRTRTRRGLAELTLCEVLGEPSLRGDRAIRATLADLVRAIAPDYAVAAAPVGAHARAGLLAAGFVPVPTVGPILTARLLTSPDGSATPEPDPRALRSWAGSIGDFELF